uniref:RING-type domain-containing protein n=1 Tax=Anopheles coluzzii TaxID=1518534 RepID=A0A8W7PZ46_ANOCL
MVLLPHNDVLSGASTEMASEGTPAKVSSVPPPPPAVADTTNTTDTTASPPPPPPSLTISISTATAANADDVTAKAMFGSAGPLSPYRPSRVKLGSVHPCITCHLCKGYLIDATTIVECLHSFCHSCIMKHLRTEQYCPQCEMMINKAKPNIKPDATLQAIVYKLVPRLYENELRRRRAFYRLHPEMATVATPEQRGEDTEYLIFSPNEKISLSLEYAEKELAEDNEELLKAKYLLCPAVFSIALLKKFIIYKYGISERQFCVEIMYKVKTIILPDYYTLMDVAYIYTWKRDAPMKYYYRIRTTESNPVELPEVALRRSPSLVTALPPAQRPSPRKNESIKLKIGLNKNTYVSILQSPQPDEPSTHSSSSSSSSSSASSPGSEGAKSSSHKSEKSKRKRKDALATLQQMEENSRELKFKIEQMKDTGLVGSKSKSGKSSAKHHQQQLALVPYKVELSAGLSQPSAVPEPERSDSKRLHSAKNGSNSSSSGSSPAYCKLKIKKSSPEDGKQPHHHHPIVLKIDQRSPEMATATLKFGMPRKSEKSMTPSPPPLPPSPPTPPSPKQKFADEKSQFLNSFQLTPIKPAEQSSSPSKTSAATTATTTTPPAAVESVAPAGKKSPTSTPSVPPVAAPTNSTSPPASNGTGTTTKRKAKDASSGGGVPRSGPKKPKLSNDEIKAIVEKTVAENIRSPSEHIVPPIFLKPKPPTTTAAAAASGQPSPPLPSSSAPTKAKDPSPKRDSPRPFVFKTPPPPPPPPIVSANNIPAVKPSQQVLPAPVPQKPAPVPIRPALTTAPKPAVPQVPQTHIRKPTAPTKLPTSAAGTAGVKSASPPAQQPLSNGSQQQAAPSNATTHSVAAGANRQQKGLELKRAQSNPSINIPPPQSSAPPVTVPRDTEISKLRPEDLKKNQKVYGPQTVPEQQQQQPPKPNTTTEATGASFAVPGPKAAPKPSSSSAGAPTGNATKSAGSAQAGQGTKARPVNYLNYALLNSKAAAAGSRTPIPSYSSSSPSYSPDSPQYSPNLNFSSKQFKYANPLAYNSHLQNMLNDRRTGSTSPPGSSTSTIPASSPSPPQDRPAATTPNASGNKRPASALSPTADDKKQQPPEKQPALLSAAAPNPADKFPSGIPDGLSVTLATDDDDAARIKNVNKQLKNNFIEIRALPEVPITEVKLPLPLPSSSTTTTASKPGRRTPPGKAAAAAAGSPATLSASPMARKSSSPSVPAPTYSVAASAPPKTSVSSAAPAPANRPADALQRKIIDLIDKPSPSSSVKTSSKPPPTMPTVSRPSTPKGGGSGGFPPVNNGNKFKLPNATVNENGTLKLNNYREVDLIPKGAAASGAKSAPSPPSGASSRPMPPPTSSASSKSIMPIAPKPSSSQLQSFANGRMAMSPPIQRSPTATSGYQQPKSKTPPSQLPSMASMGPMFDIQMKSAIAAAAASGGGTTPSKKPPTSSTTLTSATVPRRKIVPTSNSTSLVPLKTSPVAASPSTTAGGAGSKLLSSNYSDYITLHPQGPVSSSAPPSRPLFGTPHQQQHAALTQILSENFARQCFNNLPFPYLLQQFAHHQPGAASMGSRGLGSDSVTITASPMGAARGAVSQNSLTVTAIPPGQQGGGGGGSGARGSGGGGLNGPRGGIGGGGPNPASRNSS